MSIFAILNYKKTRKNHKSMEKYADYIRKIEIKQLWNGHKHILWTLDPEVNVLSGVNGIGKSTILNKVVSGVSDIHLTSERGIILETMPSDASLIRFDVIRTPDVRSEFDVNLSRIQERIVHYPHNEYWTQFCDIIDEMFAATEKTINREATSIELRQWGETLDLSRLSSGEKQMLTILATVLLEDRQPFVLFMDEPEVSLHIEWQQSLITIIRRLNPNVQIILSTHSPALIMDGWMDKVTEVSDITVNGKTY